MALTTSQLAHFYTSGYVIIDNFVSDDRTDAIRRFVESVSEGNMDTKGLGLSWEDRWRKRKLQQILNAELLSPEVQALISEDQTTSIAKQILGPDIGLHHAKITMKAPEQGGPIPWHQDFSYWQQTSAFPVQLNCLIYLDDADQQNGCLRVIPKSHLENVWRHERIPRTSTFALRIPSAVIEHCTPIDLCAKAGTAILFGPLLAHASGTNRSNRKRRFLAIEYTIPGIDKWCGRVISTRPAVPDFAAFYPAENVATITGPGPYAGQCSEDYQRQELWRLALSRIQDPSRPWVEISGSESDSTSFDWFAGRKPASNHFIRLERYPRVTSNRPDVRVLNGALEDILGRDEFTSLLNRPLGLIHFDSDLYVCVASALNGLGHNIDEGTVLVFDQFVDSAGQTTQAALAFYEFARDHLINAEYLCRTKQQVVVRVRRNGQQSSSFVEAVGWKPVSEGITIGTPQISDTKNDAQKNAPAHKDVSWTRLKRAILQHCSPSSFRMRRFFPAHAIPQFQGRGPRISYCDTHSRRRELWKYAVSLVRDDSLPWCEFGVGPGESLDWFSLQKPRQNRLFGFDSFRGIPEPWGQLPIGYFRAPKYLSNRSDVEIIEGMFSEVLARQEVRDKLLPQLGLLHIDCDLYSSTKAVLDGLKDMIKAGTIILFDEFYNYPDWKKHEVKAFYEFTKANQVSFEYIARSDSQVAVRILSVGERTRRSVRPLSWESAAIGIYIQ